MDEQAKKPLVASGLILGVGLGLAVLGGLIALLVQLLGGRSIGLLIGGLVAMCGVVPAAYGAWQGMQRETQTSLALSLAMIFVCFGIGALLIVLWLVALFRG